jgi:H+-translocating NAD(P) transhydrogenase subunit alpha
VEGSVAGEVTRIGNASVWGGKNVPSSMPGPASKLYAQNIVNILTLMTSKAEGDVADGGGVFAPDFEDEIVAGSCVTHDGAIRHEPTRAAIEGPTEGEQA